MDKLTKKQLEVSRGFTWTYYTSTAKDDKPTVLLIHGFPDTADEWEDVVSDYLVPNGFGVIAVDCLGCGGTSKPTETEHYAMNLLSKDLSEIVHKQGLDKVVTLGHDWVSPAFAIYCSLPTVYRAPASHNVSTTSIPTSTQAWSS
jgi:soluble epoxide hydrolase / lipid-phosphate phosphatase